MLNPTYDGGFKDRPERIIALMDMKESYVLSAGIKTITRNRSGLNIVPHDVVVVEMTDGDDIYSFDLPASFARSFAKRMVEFADKLENKS